MEKLKYKSISIKADPDFLELVEKFIKDFENSMGVEISIPKATKLIAIKIKNAGGLVI